MANGFTQRLCRMLGITDASATGSPNTNTGIPDETKSTSIDMRINVDSGVAGVGFVNFIAAAGSAQQFTAGAATWLVWKFVRSAQSGGFLQKADGSAFTVAQLPVANAVFAGVIAVCSDGVRICKFDGSAWQQFSVAN